jgi:hypothetical protein
VTAFQSERFIVADSWNNFDSMTKGKDGEPPFLKKDRRKKKRGMKRRRLI